MLVQIQVIIHNSKIHFNTYNFSVFKIAPNLSCKQQVQYYYLKQFRQIHYLSQPSCLASTTNPTLKQVNFKLKFSYQCFQGNAIIIPSNGNYLDMLPQVV